MSDHHVTPKGLLIHAQEFLAAAKLILEKTEVVSLPAYFLLGRSLELSLKAYLLSSGVTVKNFRQKKYGHNLHNLFQLAVEKGLIEKIPLSQIESGVIQLLSVDYMEKRLEYVESGQMYYLPYIDVTYNVAEKLAYELGSFCQ